MFDVPLCFAIMYIYCTFCSSFWRSVSVYHAIHAAQSKSGLDAGYVVSLCSSTDGQSQTRRESGRHAGDPAGEWQIYS